MRHTVLIFLLLLLSTTAVAVQAAEATMDDLTFMAGAWVGSRDQVETEEIWTAPKADLMLGVHRDVMASGRAAFEYLRIERDVDGIVYLASPQGQAPTAFRLIEAGGNRAVFSNPDHDFPQNIVYWLEDGELRVKIDGEIGGEPRVMQWRWRPEPLIPGSTLPEPDGGPRGQSRVQPGR